MVGEKRVYHVKVGNEDYPPTLKGVKVGAGKNGAVLPSHKDRFLSFLEMKKS